LIEEVGTLLTPQASAKGLAIMLDSAASVPTKLVGDAARIRQIFVNLLGNAIKFTERGRIDITVECAERTAEDASLVLKVRDTGVGIPADKLALVFDKFTQADGSMTRRYGGTGLGLTLVKQLVELMGGRITVESKVGDGTMFAIALRLPLAGAGQFAEDQLVGREAV
jgi:signal transduction histidine kinase